MPDDKALSNALGSVDVTKMGAGTKVQEVLGTIAFVVVGLNKKINFFIMPTIYEMTSEHYNNSDTNN